MQVFRLLLFPFSIIYGLVVWFRNSLFEMGVLKSQSFDLPIIVIGNLSTGGTGKTPHTEYLIRLLENKYKLGVLSRGYKRKTKGFVLASESASASSIGDEPYQIFRKFPSVEVAVCEKRVDGVNKLLTLKKKPEVLILDDAFQHRWIKSGMNILLTDYSSPFFEDYPLPSGNLRDNRAQKKRAQVIVLTKCPPNISPQEMDIIEARIGKSESQEIFYTRIVYSKPQAFLSSNPNQTIHKKVILISGIANSKLLEEHVNQNYTLLKHLKFPDHHDFSSSDIQGIHELIDSFVGNDFSVLTTEKDFVRLKQVESFEPIPMFYLPIEVEFIDRGNEFDTRIDKYINSTDE